MRIPMRSPFWTDFEDLFGSLPFVHVPERKVFNFFRVLKIVIF